MIRGMETIMFNGMQYKARVIKVKTFGERLIAGESLEEKLLDEKGNYVSDEARLVDESVFFYVEDKWLNADDEQLETKVRKEIVWC